MIWAMEKDGGRIWFPIMFSNTDELDFEKYMFKIGQTIYFLHSKEFDKALMWERLKNE